MAAAITRTEFSALQSTVSEHDEWINGNGKKGAKSRLDSLEENMSGIKSKLNTLITVNIGVGMALLGMMLWLIEQHVK